MSTLPQPKKTTAARPARLESQVVDIGEIPAVVNLSRFPGQSGVEEVHLTVRPTAPGSIETQLEWVEHAYRQALETAGLTEPTARLRRFFCSDLPNQVVPLETRPFSNPRQPGQSCSISWAGQAPMPPVKVALWAWHVSGSSQAQSHHWATGLASPDDGDTHQQTRNVFEKYNVWLQERGMALADHVIRTWLFVQDVDQHYPAMVAARRDFFAAHGLTADTHFIASTGVEGEPADLRARVTMDAYAIAGVRPEQIRYLAAPDHLCPTQAYGVTFERATAVDWRDRRQIFVSGTASIDAAGQIVHPGDVSRQLDRTLENVEALLDRAGAAPADMGVWIAYIRDPADHALVWQQLRARLGHAPLEVIVAPVCRPGWLVEVEGQATLPAHHPDLPEY